jgi:hypothetical protein
MREFNPTPNPPRETKSFRVTTEAVHIIEALAEQYNTSQGRVLEELLETYGAPLLKENKNA